jgi:FkbM family methyltransferase
MITSLLARFFRRRAAPRPADPVATTRLKAYPQLRIEVHKRFDRFISPQVAETGEWEPFETEIVDRMLGPGDVFVDIGANIGWYSIIAGAIVGAAGRVYAFEPEPENYTLAARNIALNGLTNVTLERVAIAERAGHAGLFLSVDNLGDHRLYESEAGRTMETVPTVTLGGYFAERADRIRLVKIDAQGSEGKIFAGIPDDFVKARDIGAFILEYWPGGLWAAGDSPEALMAKLEKLDLQCFVIQEPYRGLDPIALDVLQRRAYGDLRPETGFFANLLALPRSKPLPEWLPPLIRSPDATFFYKEQPG